MRICLILEGCYPYVNGGVSSWMHNYIHEMTEHEFVLVTIGAEAQKRGQFKYELAPNVVEIRELFLDELGDDMTGQQELPDFTPKEMLALKQLIQCEAPDWPVLFDLFSVRKISPISFLQSEVFMDLLVEIVEESHQQQSFSDIFHTSRSMILPLLSLLGKEMPEADVYHSIATGFAGVLASMGSYLYKKPLLLTEHGIYTREREEEILRADWVVPSMKNQWIRFFYMLSGLIYNQADRVSSLFVNAMYTQQEIGCDIDKCLVIANGIHYDRFSSIPLKKEDGWIDIGAIVRMAPIKDIKTLLYSYYELTIKHDNVRLHILGGVDDEAYYQECLQLIDQLSIPNVMMPGQVDVTKYMEKLDFTVLTSLSEGQPLSVLESLAARRPCVTTDVGCCRELLEGRRGDRLGVAGYLVPPTYRSGLTRAFEKMASSRKLREKMGNIGQKRVSQYYRYKMMIEKYRQMYEEVV